MKRTAFISLFILMFVVAGFGQKAAAAKVDASKGVRDAFDRLIDGIKQVDAGKVMASYEKSDRLLIFNNNGTATIGWVADDDKTYVFQVCLRDPLDISGGHTADAVKKIG